MAKQMNKAGEVLDTVTLDMHAPAPDPEPKKRGRGRPVTGNAKTPAERQKARRARLAAAGLKPVTLVMSVDAVAGLQNFIKFKGITPGSVVGKLITGQLLRKRNGVR